MPLIRLTKDVGRYRAGTQVFWPTSTIQRVTDNLGLRRPEEWCEVISRGVAALQAEEEIALIEREGAPADDGAPRPRRRGRPRKSRPEDLTVSVSG